jgi:hypothetical protein
MRLYIHGRECGLFRMPLTVMLQSNNSFNASGNNLDVIQLVECFSQYFPPR